MRIAALIPVFFFLLFPLFSFAAEQQQTAPAKIDSREFLQFDKCSTSETLKAALDRMIAQGKPVKKEAGIWTYSVETQFMDLPVKALGIGVCNDTGERGCGWGSYLSLSIAKPLQETRSRLKQQTGIDFTEEKRDPEYLVTTRPVLALSKSGNDTILYCDPGSL